VAIDHALKNNPNSPLSNLEQKLANAKLNSMTLRRFAGCLCSFVTVFLCAGTYATPPADPDARGVALADRFVHEQVDFDPTIAYATEIPVSDQGRFSDRTPASLLHLRRLEQEDVMELLSLKPSLLSRKKPCDVCGAQRATGVGSGTAGLPTELWNVNHFDGWQSHFAEVAQAQLVSTLEERRQAVERWSSLPHYIDVEMVNLRRGLAQGYSAPQSVVRRVILQMTEMVPADVEQSPFWSPVTRSADPDFRISFRTIILTKINPALLRYRDFLREEYLPRARQRVAVSDLPNGNLCYRAFLRQSTTLSRSPQEVFHLGEETVKANVSAVQELGKKGYGSSDVPTILDAIRAKPSEHFQSSDELLKFSEDFLTRAKKTTYTKLIDVRPRQDVVILPLASFEEDAGIGSRFVQEPDPGKPAVYRIRLKDWRVTTRADAEIAVIHEALPGHYLQKALARELQPPDLLSAFVDNAAYAEGWARYAEMMGEEARIYDTEDAAISRRIWPARGMVVDTGLHAFHWTRRQAIDYMVSSGRFTAEAANDYVDRIAVMPGQLTSYDSGALVIEGLRAEAEQKLGSRFNQKAFNRVVLEEGVVPLGELQRHVQSWIMEQDGSMKLPR
jgi:uncharacterized protein (DUF885 family)